MSQLILAEGRAGEITISPDAVSQLNKIIEAKDLIDQIYERAQEVIRQAMAEKKLKKVIGGNIVASKQLYGERYKIINAELAGVFVKEVRRNIADSEKIDAFVESHKGELPEGIDFNLRSEKVRLTTREKAE